MYAHDGSRVSGLIWVFFFNIVRTDLKVAFYTYASLGPSSYDVLISGAGGNPECRFTNKSVKSNFDRRDVGFDVKGGF